MIARRWRRRRWNVGFSALAVVALVVPFAGTSVRAATSTITTVSVTPDPSVAGQSVTIVATVTPNPGSGTIAFVIDQNHLSQSITPSGTATTFQTLDTPGIHEISATYSGNAGFDGSSDTVSHQVDEPLLNVPWFRIQAAHTYFGDYVPITGGVKPAGSNGHLLLGRRSYLLDPSTGLIPPDSVGSLNPIGWTYGTFQVAPELQDDARYDWAQGCPQTINVEPRHATPFLTVDHASVHVGDVVQFTLQAYKADDVDPVPDEWTADLWQTPEWRSAFPLLVTSTGGHRQATFRLQLTDVGVQQFHFELGSYHVWDTHISNTVTVDVQSASDQPAPALPAATPGAAASQITLSAPTTTIPKDDWLTFTATVTPAPASGQIIVYDGSEETFSIYPDPATGSGTASWRLRAGVHELRAEYQGSDAIGPSISAPLEVTVTALPMAISLETSANPTDGGTAFTVSASMSPAPPRGTRLTWYADDTYDTSQTLDGTQTVASRDLALQSRAEPYRFRAELIFDGPYADAHSTTLEQVVNDVPVTLTLDTPSGPLRPEDPITFTGHLSPTSPDGDVELFVDDIGVKQATISGGTASASTRLNPGQHRVEMVFYGFEPYGDDRSQKITVNVGSWATRDDIHGTSVVNEGNGYTSTSLVGVSTALDLNSQPATTFQLSNDGAHWATFQYNPFGGDTVMWSLTDTLCGGSQGDGVHTIYYRFANDHAETSPVESVDVTITSPGSQSLVLDRVAPAASRPFVAYRLGSKVSPAHLLPITVSWSGSDDRSNIKRFDLQQQIDGAAWTAVPLGTATSTSANRGIVVGHSYRYRVRATDRSLNVSSWSVGLTFHAIAFQESKTAIHYTGTWHSAPLADAYGGATRYSTLAGSRATLTTSASSLAWVSAKSPSAGSAQVYIDGVLTKTVTLAAPRSAGVVMFSRHWSTVGTHTIQIRVVGSARVDVDAFLVTR